MPMVQSQLTSGRPLRSFVSPPGQTTSSTQLQAPQPFHPQPALTQLSSNGPRIPERRPLAKVPTLPSQHHQATHLQHPQQPRSHQVRGQQVPSPPPPTLGQNSTKQSARQGDDRQGNLDDCGVIVASPSPIDTPLVAPKATASTQLVAPVSMPLATPIVIPSARRSMSASAPTAGPQVPLPPMALSASPVQGSSEELSGNISKSQMQLASPSPEQPSEEFIMIDADTKVIPDGRPHSRSGVHKRRGSSIATPNRNKRLRNASPDVQPNTELHDSRSNSYTSSGAPSRHPQYLSFDEVYQNGKATFKHRMEEFPSGSGKFYIVKCDEHGVHFNNSNPISGAAKHLNGKDHHHMSKDRKQAIDILGYHIYDCTPELAQKNNETFNDAISQGYKVFTQKDRYYRETYNLDGTLKCDTEKAEIASSRRGPRVSLGQSKRMSLVESPIEPVLQPLSRSASPVTEEISKSVDPAKPIGPLKDTKEFKGVINAVPGEIYYGFWTKNKMKYAVVVCGWGDQRCIGHPGKTLGGLWPTLLNRAPPCYNIDRQKKGIIGWAEGYEDGGPLVQRRAYPVQFFDKSRGVAWLPCRHLSPFQMNDPIRPTDSEHPFNQAREFYATLRGFPDFQAWLDAGGKHRPVTAEDSQSEYNTPGELPQEGHPDQNDDEEFNRVMFHGIRMQEDPNDDDYDPEHSQDENEELIDFPQGTYHSMRRSRGHRRDTSMSSVKVVEARESRPTTSAGRGSTAPATRTSTPSANKTSTAAASKASTPSAGKAPPSSIGRGKAKNSVSVPAPANSTGSNADNDYLFPRALEFLEQKKKESEKTKDADEVKAREGWEPSHDKESSLQIESKGGDRKGQKGNRKVQEGDKKGQHEEDREADEGQDGDKKGQDQKDQEQEEGQEKDKESQDSNKVGQDRNEVGQEQEKGGQVQEKEGQEQEKEGKEPEEEGQEQEKEGQEPEEKGQEQEKEDQEGDQEGKKEKESQEKNEKEETGENQRDNEEKLDHISTADALEKSLESPANEAISLSVSEKTNGTCHQLGPSSNDTGTASSLNGTSTSTLFKNGAVSAPSTPKSPVSIQEIGDKLKIENSHNFQIKQPALTTTSRVARVSPSVASTPVIAKYDGNGAIVDTWFDIAAYSGIDGEWKRGEGCELLRLFLKDGVAKIDKDDITIIVDPRAAIRVEMKPYPDRCDFILYGDEGNILHQLTLVASQDSQGRFTQPRHIARRFQKWARSQNPKIPLPGAEGVRKVTG